MSHTEFKALLKKVNLKPKGVKEIVLEVSDGALAGKIDLLSDMIDGRVAIAIDSEIVRYNVQINTRTEKPVRSYKVDDKGIVSEIKPEGEQMEMDLGVAKKPDPITEVPEEISREVVDEFILSGLAPKPEKHWYPMAEWIARLATGETFLKLAGEAGMSSGRIVDIVDDYRQSVAPLAAKWDEWRKAREESGAQPDIDDEEDVTDEVPDGDDTEPPVAEDSTPSDTVEQQDEIELIDAPEEGSQPAEPAASDDELSDWEQEVMGQADQPPAQPMTTAEAPPEDIEQYILSAKPQYEDIPFDFPALLERRKAGETWLMIAKSLGIPSTKLSTEWGKYRKRIKEQFGGDAA